MGMGSLNTLTSAIPVAWAVDATVFILAFLFGLQLSWRASGAIKWDRYVLDSTGNDIRVLRFLVALLGGFLFGICMAALAICVSLIRVLF